MFRRRTPAVAVPPRQVRRVFIDSDEDDDSDKERVSATPSASSKGNDNNNNDDDGGDKSEGQPTSTGRRVRYRTGASVKGLPPAKKNRVVRRKMAAIERALKELREVAGWSGVCMLGLPVTDKETQYQQLFSPDMCLRVHDIDPLRQEFFAAMRAKYPDIPDMEMQPQPGRLFVRQGMETGPALACYNVSIETLRIMQSVGGTCRQIVNDMAGNGSAPDFLSPGK
jgi:hypothetical protein